MVFCGPKPILKPRLLYKPRSLDHLKRIGYDMDLGKGTRAAKLFTSATLGLTIKQGMAVTAFCCSALVAKGCC